MRNGPGLSIGAAARATGVGADVLRSWESRYGFPIPLRQPSGHRRYTDEHVAQIAQVQRLRASGLSLDAAIGRVRQRAERAETSIFAGLRRRWPQHATQVMSKRGLVALSRAIEDECLVHAAPSVLVGCFQRERHYRQSERRWRELCRTARWSAVFADFASPAGSGTAPAEIAIGASDPLQREWAVICEGPDLAACVVGLERVRSSDVGPRRFETLWSVDPAVVRDAAELAAGLAARGTQLPPPSPAVAAADDAVALRVVVALLDRTVQHLER